jgi:hypothetical protein
VGCCCLLGIAAVLSAGCERRFTIRQTEYVNNAMHSKRPENKRTGEPLELAIVLFLPKDYDNERNKDLRPGQPITSAMWWERRPGGPGTNTFDIPQGQIYRLLLHGKSLEGDKEVNFNSEKDLKVEIKDDPLDLEPHPINSKKCAIYVFPRFTDDTGKVLEVAPLVFSPPSEFARDLVIEVGVDKAQYEQKRGNWGQYIRVAPAPK